MEYVIKVVVSFVLWGLRQSCWFQPTGHVVPIREIRLAAGAEFIVVICGAIMTMPGLPRKPAADNIRVNSAGRIEGLF